MAAWDDRLTWFDRRAPKTTCAYCGVRIVQSGAFNTDPERDKIRRQAARIACPLHWPIAIFELLLTRGGDRSVERVDEATGDDAA